MRARALAAACVGALLLTGCAGGGGGEGDEGDAHATGSRFTVVTDLYPTTFAIQQVAGDDVDVVQLAPAGVEPHDYELSPSQVAQIADADLVAYIPGMIPAVEAAVAQSAANRAVDVTKGITRLSAADDDAEHAADESQTDPHVWLDPTNMAIMGRTAAAALTAAGSHADATALTAAMTDLHDEAAADLAHCTITPMVVNHAAFGYLAHAYGFQQVAISGLAPDAEPSPRRMAQIADLVEQQGVTTIYFESLASPAAAQAIAAETGASTALLDPVEGNTDGRGYEAIMRANLAALHTGQGCA